MYIFILILFYLIVFFVCLFVDQKYVFKFLFTCSFVMRIPIFKTCLRSASLSSSSCLEGKTVTQCLKKTWWVTVTLSRKEGNVLFNDALNTFYLRLYDVRHMVKDHSDGERGNLLPQHGLLFLINRCTIPQMGLHIPQALLHQSWSTGWNEK